MKMDMFIGTVLLGVSILTNTFCRIEEKETFDEALQFCKKRGKIIMPYGEQLVEEFRKNSSIRQLWVGAPWYNGEHCYVNTPDAHNIVQNGSLFNCSTQCRNRDKNFTHIGLQKNRCSCFIAFNRTRECTSARDTESSWENLRFGEGENKWYIYRKDYHNYSKSNVFQLTQSGKFRLVSSITDKNHFICTVIKPTEDEVPPTTLDYGDVKETSDNSFMIPVLIAAGIAALLTICVSVVAIIKKRNHAEIAREETNMQVMEHNYSSVQKVGRPTIENPSHDAVSLNKPQVDLKDNEENADIDVYDTTGASNNTQNNSSEIYDHTNNTEGVYDVTDHVKQKENDADNTYDHV